MSDTDHIIDLQLWAHYHPLLTTSSAGPLRDTLLRHSTSATSQPGVSTAGSLRSGCCNEIRRGTVDLVDVCNAGRGSCNQSRDDILTDPSRVRRRHRCLAARIRAPRS